MNKLLLLTFILLLFTSCNKYKIEGSASDAGLDGRMLFIKIPTSNDHVWKSIDSCEVIHGEFTMKGKVDSAMMATLFMDETAILPVVIEKGSIKIDINGLNTKVSGTPLNDALYSFLDKQNNLNTKIEDLLHKESQMILNGEDPDRAHEMVYEEGKKLSDKMNKLVVEFISDNFDNVLSSGVFMMIVSNMPYPILTPEINEIIEKAPSSFKDNFMVKEFLNAAQENANKLH